MPYACQGDANAFLANRSDDQESVEEAGTLDACGVCHSCNVRPLLLTALAGSNLVLTLHRYDNPSWAARTTGRKLCDSSRYQRRCRGWACKPTLVALEHQLLPWQLGLNDNKRTFASRLGAYQSSSRWLTPSSDAPSCAASAGPSQHRSQATGAQSGESARPDPIRHNFGPQQQRRCSRRPSSSALPYSVPTLAVGDVFLSCNTVAGLQPQDDWDGWLTKSTGGSHLLPGDIRHHSPSALRHPVAALDPAAELLLRMSPPVGGHRLMFVSQEAAEVVRRAMLLNRYTKIMEGRAAVVEAAASAGAAARKPSSESRSLSSCRASPTENASSNCSGITPAGCSTASSSSTSRTTGRCCTGADGRPTVQNGLSGRLQDTLVALGANLAHWAIPVTAAAVGVSGGGPAGASRASELLERVSGAVDVSNGPRPRLPSAPLLSPIPLPQHVVTPVAPALQALTLEDSGPVAGDAAETSTHGGPMGADSGPAESAADGAQHVTAEHKAVGASAAAVAPSLAKRWRQNTGDVLRELKELEEQRIIADAQALLKAGRARHRIFGGGGGGGDGFLPPFSFSSYVARLPLESALKALIASYQPPSPVAAIFAAAPTHTHDARSCSTGSVGIATNDQDLPASPLLRRRFVLVPDAADEHAAHASRILDETVREVQEELAAAARDEVTPLGASGGLGYGTEPGCRGRLQQRPAGKDGDEEDSKHETQEDAGDKDARQATFGFTRALKPRLALNLYDSDSSHWVLDAIDDGEHEELAAADGGMEHASSLHRGRQRSSGNGSSSGPALSPEPFIRGKPSGLEDVEHLLRPSEPSLGYPHSAAVDAQPITANVATAASAARATLATASTSSTPGNDSDSDSAPPDRTPLFLLPGVTMSVRSAEGTLLRLRPAFLSLQQLAAALTLARDAAVVAWRRQRSEQRWKVAAALDVLTVHFAGFPIIKFPPMRPSGSIDGGGAGGGDDEDSDDGIPEAKELMREMGAGPRRPVSSANAINGRRPPSPPSGPLTVLATMAVGVVSFGAWCLAAAGDVWDDLYTRTHWGLTHVGLPQHVNVKPTYLEDEMAQLAAGNMSAVAAAVAVRSKAAKQRRARRRQQAAERQAVKDQQVVAEQRKDPEAEGVGEGNHQQQQEGPGIGTGLEGMEKGPWAQERGSHRVAGGPWREDEDGEEVVSCHEDEEHRREDRQAGGCAASLVGTDGGSDAASEAATLAGMLAGIAATDLSTTVTAVSDGTSPEEMSPQGADQAAAQPASAQNKHHRKIHHRGASAGGRSVMDLPPETMMGLTLLSQLTWAVARAAQAQVHRATSGGIGGGVDVGPGVAAAVGMDMLMRVAVGGGAGVSGGGNGVTFATNGAGELGLTARMEVKPTPVSSWAAASKAKAGSAAATTEEIAGAGAGMEGPSGAAADPSTGGESAGAGATAGKAEGSARMRGGISVRNLGTWGSATRKLEVQHSAYKLPLQMKQPYSFEASLHINNRKLVGDLPYDAPDELLPRLQPAGPTPLPSPTAVPTLTAVTPGALYGPASRWGSQGPEAHGMILIGDLGLDFGGLYDDQAIRPPAIGFVDLGGLLPVHVGVAPTTASSNLVIGKECWAEQAFLAKAGGAATDAGSAMEGDCYPCRVGGEVELAGAGRSGLGNGVGWAASGRSSGSWGRWGR